MLIKRTESLDIAHEYLSRMHKALGVVNNSKKWGGGAGGKEDDDATHGSRGGEGEEGVKKTTMPPGLQPSNVWRDGLRKE